MNTIKRNFTIDVIRGILIFLVVIGHYISGSIENNIFRYLIYSFHMPLFFALSGYLFNIDKIIKIPFKDFFKNYIYRILKPWSIAVVVYYLLLNYDNFSLKKLLLSFINNYYHLWFGLAFVIYLLITYFFIKIIKNKRNRDIVLFILGLMTFALTTYFRFVETTEGMKLLATFLIKFQFNNYIYFILGYLIKEYFVCIINNIYIYIYCSQFCLFLG